MSDHISGQQARELLDGTTPGPWNWEDRDYPDYDEGHEVLWNGTETALRSQDSEQYSSWVSGSDNDKALAAAAPALAETVAWLYGREPDDVDEDGRAEWRLEPFLEVVAVPGAVIDIDGREHSPDGAVEYARALIAAADRARRRTD